VEQAKTYASQGADELVFLDITASVENRKTMAILVERIADVINIPFTVGGGITNVNDAAMLISSGADKISINSSAVSDPHLISDIAARFGRQCVVVAIDTNYTGSDWVVYTHGGKKITALKAAEWAEQAEEMGAGEILLTSMTADGTSQGFSLSITREICNLVNIPVIASGGAGTMNHFREVFRETGCSGALAAGVFHFGKISIPDLKKYLSYNKINVRC
jgi:cyclase